MKEDNKDKMWVFSMNIVTKNNILLNKDNCPILLYTHNPDSVLIDIYKNDTYIGGSIFDFCVSNITVPVVKSYSNDSTDDNYIGSTIKYIYYDIDTNKSTIGSIDIEDVIPLKIDSDNVYIKDLYYYYIYKALNAVYIKHSRIPLLASGYTQLNIKDGLKSIINRLMSCYKKLDLADIVKEVKAYFTDILGLKQHNIDELMKVFMFNKY